MVYGTDGAIEAAELTVLEDDKSVQPVYAPTPIIREAVLKANPKIEEVLAPIFKGLTADVLRKLERPHPGRWRAGEVGCRILPRDNGFLK